MSYTREQFVEKVQQLGEVMVVMDSGVEYDIHTAQLSDEEFDGQVRDDEIKIEGVNGHGEYLELHLPVDSIEHIYTHKEL